MRHNSDPRKAGGNIAGPGGPADRNAVVLDTSKAVLLDYAETCIAHLSRRGEPLDAWALLLEGKINQSPDRTRVLYLMDMEGAADVVAHFLSLAQRNGQAEAFRLAVDASTAWVEPDGKAGGERG